MKVLNRIGTSTKCDHWVEVSLTDRQHEAVKTDLVPAPIGYESNNPMMSSNDSSSYGSNLTSSSAVMQINEWQTLSIVR